MADELKVQVVLSFAKGTIPRQKFDSGLVSVTVSGSNYHRTVQAVGTSIEALSLGDVATPGYCIMHNLDATNFVQVYPDATDDPVIKLKAGEWALFRFASAAPYVKADTGACNLEVFLLPN